MTTDASKIETGAPKSQWNLPSIINVRTASIPYKAPKYRNFEPVYARHKEAIEFLVETDGPFPVRALSPVLYVGETAVIEWELIEKNVYRFLAFEPEKLEKGAQISLAWPGQPPEKRQKTEFRYEL